MKRPISSAMTVPTIRIGTTAEGAGVPERRPIQAYFGRFKAHVQGPVKEPFSAVFMRNGGISKCYTCHVPAGYFRRCQWSGTGAILSHIASVSIVYMALFWRTMAYLSVSYMGVLSLLSAFPPDTKKERV